MAEPARKPEPREEPSGFVEPVKQPKIQRSGFAIWSLLFGLAGSTVLLLPVVPSGLQALDSLRAWLALFSLVAALSAAIAISQIQQGTRRGTFMAVIGGSLGIIGLVAYFIV